MLEQALEVFKTNNVSTDDPIKLLHLKQYKKYRILKFVPFVDTFFGPRVEIHLDDGTFTHLTARFNKLSIEDILELNQMKVTIMRTGARPCNLGMMADFLFFNEMEEYMSSAFNRLQHINLMERPYLPLSKLNPNKIHRVVKLSVIENRNGWRPIATFADGNFSYLPDNYEFISLAEINQINDQLKFKDIFIAPFKGYKLVMTEKEKEVKSHDCSYD